VDGDRIGFVTAEGVALSEEYTLPLAAQTRLARRPGPVVTNLSTSRMVDAVARRFGQTVLRTMVGEGHVMDAGLSEGAALAGEGSGGVAMLPVTMSFDGLLTLALLLEAMARTGESLADLTAQIPQYAIRKGELACPPELVYRTLESFRKRFADRNPDCTDGVRVEWDDAWLHVRASNTEPLLRVIAEADTAERANAIFEEAMTSVRRLAFGHEGR
jgi:phosphomannomutase